MMPATVKAPVVALLEDEREVANHLAKQLEAVGIDVSTAYDFETFTHVVNGTTLDVASIDWEINEREKGPEALRLLNAEQPTAAKIVLTKHERREAAAKMLNADAFLVKGEHMNRYVPTIQDGVRLGQARRVLAALKPFGEMSLPALRPGEFVNDATEEQIRTAAWKTAFNAAINFRGYDGLRKEICRIGWWRTFDAASFVRLIWREKLVTLLVYARVSEEDTAQILGISLDLSRSLLLGARADAIVDRALLEKIDFLLSIMNFVLQISSFEPELMPHFCRARNSYSDSTSRPPWDDHGLLEYMKLTGPSSLTKCLMWIRSN